MQQQDEPSVEEILDSIKKVIARDNREGAILDRRRRTASTLREAHAEPADQHPWLGRVQLRQREHCQLLFGKLPR